MQFKVPQFIDVEDKIFGPYTFRQFIYLAGGAGLVFVLFKLLPIYISILPMLAVAGLSVALTFYKVNNRPFINFLENFFNHLFRKKMFLWQKTETTTTAKEKEKPKPPTIVPEPKLTGSKLKELAWSLDIHELKK